MLKNRCLSTKKILLLAIIFSHLFALILSSFYDKSLHTNQTIEMSKPKFWFWFFMWWSAWASLLTIPWGIYKLLKQKKSGLVEQIFDLVVAETNLLSGAIFCWGGFLLSKPARPAIVCPLIGQVKTIWVWYFYNFFWHLLGPGLAFYYFWKYSSVEQLKKQKILSLLGSLFNPTLYLLYNMALPLFSSYYPKNFPAQPYTYPSDYPYPPFFWINAQVASPSENQIKQAGKKSKFYFWHAWSKWAQSLIWLAITIVFWYLIFSVLFWILIKTKGKKILKPFFLLNLLGFAFLLFLSGVG
ncbi:MAG: hypothetical protein MRERC_14c012 [Mycoplasmataceae bacterium RC_NB112A]|nr:MAG: hypothetical protein MRERC_14c012 [Mycoplasmataceae bacterium RC_NB112A]